jgi:hypothetical protein
MKMSAATIDRALQPQRERCGVRCRDLHICSLRRGWTSRCALQPSAGPHKLRQHANTGPHKSGCQTFDPNVRVYQQLCLCRGSASAWWPWPSYSEARRALERDPTGGRGPPWNASPAYPLRRTVLTPEDKPCALCQLLPFPCASTSAHYERFQPNNCGVHEGGQQRENDHRGHDDVESEDLAAILDEIAEA